MISKAGSDSSSIDRFTTARSDRSKPRPCDPAQSRAPLHCRVAADTSAPGRSDRLARLRRRWFPLAQSVGHKASLVEGTPGSAPLLRLERTISSDDGTARVLAFFNLGPQAQQLPASEGAELCVLLRSEEPEFGGTRGAADDGRLMPFEFCLFGPSRWSKR